MVHLGTSVNEKIFVHEKRLHEYDKNDQISRDYLIRNFGTFSLRSDYYRAFVEAGPFVTGDKSILFGRAQLTHDSMCNKKTFGDLLKDNCNRAGKRAGYPGFKDVLPSVAKEGRNPEISLVR